jgi:enterochelin esterase-like enzyme
VPLTSMRLLVFLVLLAVGGPVAVGVLMYRSRGLRRSPWVLPAAVAVVLVAQASAVAAVAVDVNRDYGFYPDWASLFGTGVAPPVVAKGVRLGLNGQAVPHRPILRVPEPASGTGRYEEVTVKGALSGVTQTVVAWLPPQYGDRRYAKTRFPVVMVLGGSYRPVSLVVQRLHLATAASAEIKAGRVQPFIAVFPEINVSKTVDTECTDVPGAPQAFTWLDRDVPKWVTSKLRASHDYRQWSVMGWSTGGYCAALLHLRDPSRFAAAASIEGYYDPEPDATTGTLASALQQDPLLARDASPTWLIEHQPPLNLHLLVMTSMKDPQSRPQSLQFLANEKNVPGVQPYVLQDLGHTLDTFAAVLPPVLGWLADVAGA